MTNWLQRLPILRAGTGLAMLLIAAGAASAQEDTVVATVNGQPVTEAELELAMSDLDQQFAQLPPEQRRAAALSALIEIRLLAAEAEELGLGENPAFQQRMVFLRERALHSAYIEEQIAGSVTDEELQARYDEEIAQIAPTEELRARHIIVESEEEAASLIEELDGGADFEELAREHSGDGAAAQGGDLGYFAQGQMVPEFEEAAFAMEVGAHSDAPVQTQFGWHVIKVEDRRDRTPPTFEQVSQQIRSLVLRETYLDKVRELRAAAEVEISDEGLRGLLDQMEGEAAPEAGDEPAGVEGESPAE